jgi:PAB1-binding protein PBP1
VASGDTITPANGLVGDDDTFGPGANGNTSWDQFSANETLFGVKASFDEDAYTTKLDRSAPDFKERERKAQRIANEIIGVSRVGV